MSRITISISDKPDIPTGPSTSYSPGIVPYVHLGDKEVNGFIRSCASCPAVWVMKDDNHALITQQWQYYMLAINPSMTLENVFLLLDNNLAFTNSTGFRQDLDPRADYFHNKNTADGSKPPQFDKIRTCSYNTVTGIEEFSLVTALKTTASLLQPRVGASKATLADVRQAISTKVLTVRTFDSRLRPPLKPGRSYPTRISEIDASAYLYLPQHNREMFIVANIVNRAGAVTQFPRGGLYNWTGDGTPYSFLPHISNHFYGKVQVKLDKFKKLEKDAAVFRPYTT